MAGLCRTDEFDLSRVPQNAKVAFGGRNGNAELPLEVLPPERSAGTKLLPQPAESMIGLIIRGVLPNVCGAGWIVCGATLPPRFGMVPHCAREYRAIGHRRLCRFVTLYSCMEYGVSRICGAIGLVRGSDYRVIVIADLDLLGEPVTVPAVVLDHVAGITVHVEFVEQ